MLHAVQTHANNHTNSTHKFYIEVLQSVLFEDRKQRILNFLMKPRI